MTDLRTHLQQGWLFVAGFALAAVGFSFAPQGGQSGEPGQGTVSPPMPGFAPISNADSNGRMIAVTGIDLTGSAILYVIDTENPHIAVYQAQGGAASSQSIKLVAARNIALDLQLDGFNDKSQYSFKNLEEQFRSGGLLTQQPGSQQSK